jgi:hypothetical protein
MLVPVLLGSTGPAGGGVGVAAPPHEDAIHTEDAKITLPVERVRRTVGATREQ